MKRRFTRANVKAVFDQWPQAVSMDDSDLRVLHDMASAGAQSWRQNLPWPDYLWLDLEGDLPDLGNSEIRREIYNFSDRGGRTESLRFGVVAQRDTSHKPQSGISRVISQPIGMIEVNTIESDLVSKVQAYRPTIPWSRFIKMKLHQWFDYRLAKADRQIAGGKRLIGFANARGIAVIVNEASPALRPELASGYLAKAIAHYQYLDGILYLSDSPDEAAKHQWAFIHKQPNDEIVNRISKQVRMMFANFKYDSGVPVSRTGSQPKLLARIDMDERSRKMCRSWATGWRRADDTSPIPAPTMSMSFVRKENFVSGLPATAPDPKLLDLRLRWDRDGRNLRLEN